MTPASRASSSFYPATALFSALACITLTFFSACEHKREYIPETDPKAPPPPMMQAYGEFFDGKLLVEASLGRGFRMRPGKMKEYENRRDSSSGSDAFSDVYYIGGDEEDQVYIPRMSNSTLPPVALRLRVTNEMQQAIDVEIIECNSPLGNFAVRPEKLSIAPGKTESPEPMNSLLGVTNDEFQLKIGLKVGAFQETKILMMHNIKHPPTDKETQSTLPASPATTGTAAK